MDLPEYGFSNDESFFGGLMGAYPPVPDHLKVVRQAGAAEEENVAASVDEADADIEVEDETVLERDMSDEEIIRNNARLDELEQGGFDKEVLVGGKPVDELGEGLTGVLPAVVAPRSQRRLKKKAQRPAVVGEEVGGLDGDPVHSSFEA